MPPVVDPWDDLYDAGLGRISNMTVLEGSSDAPWDTGGQPAPEPPPPEPVPDPVQDPVPVTPSAPASGGGGGGGSDNSFNILGTPGSRDVGYAQGAAVPRWQSWAPAMPTPIASIAQVAQQKLGGLLTDPQLPELPQGEGLDSLFYAEEAQAHQQTNAAYQDILSQYGYDKGGIHIPGAIELQAGRNERDLITGLVRATEGVVGGAQQAGTVFSGYTGQQLAEKQQPYVTGLGDMAVDIPKQLASQVEKAQDLMRAFILQRNLLMQQALLRYAALLAQRQSGGPSGTTPTSTPTTEPPPRADYANYAAWQSQGPYYPGPYNPNVDYVEDPPQPHYF